MAEVGCLRDGHFNNLQVDGSVIINSTSGPHHTGNLSSHVLTKMIPLARDAQPAVDTRAGQAHTGSPSDSDAPEGGDANVDGINYFRWDSHHSDFQFFSYNIFEQTIFPIPVRHHSGYDISGDQTNGKGRSYIMDLHYQGKDDPIGESKTLVYQGSSNFNSEGLVEIEKDLVSAHQDIGFARHFPTPSHRTVDLSAKPFMVSFTFEIPDGSGFSECIFGIRKVEGFQDNFTDYSQYWGIGLIGTEALNQDGHRDVKIYCNPGDGSGSDDKVLYDSITGSPGGFNPRNLDEVGFGEQERKWRGFQSPSITYNSGEVWKFTIGVDAPVVEFGPSTVKYNIMNCEAHMGDDTPYPLPTEAGAEEHSHSIPTPSAEYYDWPSSRPISSFYTPFIHIKQSPITDHLTPIILHSVERFIPEGH